MSDILNSQSEHLKAIAVNTPALLESTKPVHSSTLTKKSRFRFSSLASLAFFQKKGLAQLTQEEKQSAKRDQARLDVLDSLFGHIDPEGRVTAQRERVEKFIETGAEEDFHSMCQNWASEREIRDGANQIGHYIREAQGKLWREIAVWLAPAVSRLAEDMEAHAAEREERDRAEAAEMRIEHAASNTVENMRASAERMRELARTIAAVTSNHGSIYQVLREIGIDPETL